LSLNLEGIKMDVEIITIKDGTPPVVKSTGFTIN
jgi:hypothetical protein